MQTQITNLFNKRNKRRESLEDVKLVPQRPLKQPKLHSFIQSKTSNIAAVTKSLEVPEPSEPLVHRKTIKDNIHGFIEFEPVCMAIIDTIPFQRLRNLNQVGAVSHVYIGATHSRFQHSLGVAHLAEKMALSLQQNQPNLGITCIDVLCVKIAGLCHDLGHGPYSHLFDGMFMKTVNVRPELKTWTHEQGSIDLFDFMLESNQIKLQDYGLGEKDIVFIKEAILGHGLQDKKILLGRPEQKHFLYDIVNNAHSGLDVDKLDYFERDSKMANVPVQCDKDLVIRTARVLPDSNGRLTICFPAKLVEQIMCLFKTRFDLHHTIYQHKNVKGIELMIADTLIAVNDVIKVKGVKMSDTPLDMKAYQYLDDRILGTIMLSSEKNEGVAKAQDLLDRISTKRYYTRVASLRTEHVLAKSESEIAASICKQDCLLGTLVPEDIIVRRVKIHYGNKKQNPMDFVRFYAKESTTTSTCFSLEHTEYDTPSSFMDEQVVVYVRDCDKINIAKLKIAAWRERVMLEDHSPWSSVGHE